MKKKKLYPLEFYIFIVLFLIIVYIQYNIKLTPFALIFYIYVIF